MAPLSLSGWLERLELQHPVEIDLGLERVAAVARELGLTTSPAVDGLFGISNYQKGSGLSVVIHLDQTVFNQWNHIGPL